MTAIGGKYAVQDNREVPDTLEVLWQYPGNTLATFSQFNCNAAPAGINSGEVEFRGTKGTVYIQSNGWEVVPDVLTDHEFPARTPIDRGVERGWREGAKAVIEPRKVTGGKQDTADHARNFLDCVVSRQPCNCRHRDRPPRHHGRADRQRRLEDQNLPGMGRQGGEVHQQRGGEQAAPLRLPAAVSSANLKAINSVSRDARAERVSVHALRSRVAANRCRAAGASPFLPVR